MKSEICVRNYENVLSPLISQIDFGLIIHENIVEIKFPVVFV